MGQIIVFLRGCESGGSICVEHVVSCLAIDIKIEVNQHIVKDMCEVPCNLGSKHSHRHSIMGCHVHVRHVKAKIYY